MGGPNVQVPSGSSCLAHTSAASREVVLPRRDQLFVCEDSWFPLWNVIVLPAYFPFEHVAFVCHMAHAELLQHFYGTNIIIVRNLPSCALRRLRSRPSSTKPRRRGIAALRTFSSSQRISRRLALSV